MSEDHKPTSFQIDELLEEEGNKVLKRQAEEAGDFNSRDKHARGSDYNRKQGRDYRADRSDGHNKGRDLFEGKLDNTGGRRGSLVSSHDGRRSNRSSNGNHDEDDGNSANRDSRGYRHRHRSRSPRRERSRDRYHDRRDDRYRRDRSPDGRRRHDNDRRRDVNGRDGPSSRGNEERPADDSAALTEEQRDKRTVFVQQLAGNLRDKDVRRFFESRAGLVQDVQIVRDRHSGRSKGVGYVEFKDEDSVTKALELTGKKLMDVPIIVSLSEAEKNRVARETNRGPTAHNQAVTRLYVGNIDFNVTEDDLRKVFECYGSVDMVQLQRDDNGRSRGYGFVNFEKAEDAVVALKELQHFDGFGRPMRVGLGPYNSAADAAKNSQGQSDQQRGSDHSGLGGRGQAHGGSNKREDRSGAASALDDNDVNGVNFANVSRQSLMNKLARKEEPETKAQIAKRESKQTGTTTMATRCICVKHVWTQKDTEEADWQKFLEEDFKAECSSKYGDILHLGVDTSSTEGELYIKFMSTIGSLKAYQGLQGRSYDGRFIYCDYVVDAVYNALFPKAAKF